MQLRGEACHVEVEGVEDFVSLVAWLRTIRAHWEWEVVRGREQRYSYDESTYLNDQGLPATREFYEIKNNR